jgi:hypothetical protein
MNPKPEQIVSVKGFEHLSGALTDITNKLTDLKPPRKKNWISLLAVLVSIIALVLTM